MGVHRLRIGAFRILQRVAIVSKNRNWSLISFSFFFFFSICFHWFPNIAEIAEPHLACIFARPTNESKVIDRRKISQSLRKRRGKDDADDISITCETHARAVFLYSLIDDYAPPKRYRELVARLRRASSLAGNSQLWHTSAAAAGALKF